MSRLVNRLAGGVARAWKTVAARLRFDRLVGDRKGSKGRQPGLGLAAVQGELSLQTVRVVRNDLMDSDLMIVPAGVSRNRLPRRGPNGVHSEQQALVDHLSGGVVEGRPR